MPSTYLSLREDDVVRLILEFLNARDLHITQLSLERETGVINGNYSKDVLFLRQLILDGQWDNVLEFVQPLAGIEAFDYDKFKFAILKQKFIELLCIRSEIQPYNSVENIVEELVSLLNKLQEVAPSKDAYSNLCLLLTLPKITEHASYKKWNPSNARVQCFREIHPLVEHILPYDKKSGGLIPKCAKNDRLMQLLIKGVLYESCVNYCQAKATGSSEAQSKDVKFSQLLDSTGFVESDLSLMSWLQSIPAETYGVPFDQKFLDVDIEKLERPSLHTSWTEQMLVTPIKPQAFPHLSMPFKRPRSAADAMTRSLRPLPEGAPIHPAIMALSAIDTTSVSFHLTGVKSSKIMNASVDRLFDNAEEGASNLLENQFPKQNEEMKVEVLKTIDEARKVGDTENVKEIQSISSNLPPQSILGNGDRCGPSSFKESQLAFSFRKVEKSTASTPEQTANSSRRASTERPPIYPMDSRMQCTNNDIRKELLEYQVQKQRECEDYLKHLGAADLRESEMERKPENIPMTNGESPNILIALSFYASGSYQTLVGQNYFSFASQSSVSRAIRQVSNALNTPAIFHKHVKWPMTNAERNEVKSGSRDSPARESPHPSTFPSTLRKECISPLSVPRRETPSPTNKSSPKRHSMGSYPNLSSRNGVNYVYYNRRDSLSSNGVRDMKRDYVGSNNSLTRKSLDKKSSLDSLDNWHSTYDHNYRPYDDYKAQTRNGSHPIGSPTTKSISSDAESNRPTFKPVTVLEDQQAFRCAEFHPSGKLYAVGSNTKTLRICTYPKIEDVKESSEPIAPSVVLKRTKHHKGSIYCLTWSPAGDLLATGSNDKSVKLMSFNSHACNFDGQEVELNMHDGTVRDVCFIEDTSNKTSLLVSGGAGHCKVQVTDCATGKLFRSLSGHTGHVLSLYNWGGALFVSGSQDKSVRFWDLRTGKCVNSIGPSTGAKASPVTSVAVDPSGRLLVCGYDDGVCALYDVRGSRMLQQFAPHQGDVRSVRYSPGAYYLLTAGYDGRVVLTDLQGDLTCPLPSVTVARHTDKVISARWHPEDFSFLSTSADKTAVLWTIPPV